MKRAVHDRATIRVADRTDLSGRATAEEVNLERFHNRIRKVCAATAPVNERNQTWLRLICDRSWPMRACSRLCLALAIAVSLFPAPLHAQFAYVANAGSNNVSAYSIGADGALTPVPRSPFEAGSEPVSVAVDPTGKFAYVANLTGNNVSAYSIRADGGGPNPKSSHIN